LICILPDAHSTGEQPDASGVFQFKCLAVQPSGQQDDRKAEIAVLLDCTLLINGAEAFPRIIHRLQTAQKEIIISMFVWRDDSIGNTIASEVLCAAERGVKVRIIKDKLAAAHELAEENRQSFFHKPTDLSTFVQRNILSILYFRDLGKKPPSGPNPLVAQMEAHPNITLDVNTLRHDHSKFYLIDNSYLILGGINIENKELYADKKNLKYADYMVEISSKREIAEFRDTIIEHNHANLATIKSFCVNRRDLNVFRIKPRLLELLEQAHESVDFEMAYWGDRDVRDKIIERAHQGIRISIITSMQSNLQNDLYLKTMAYFLRKTKGRIKIYLSKRMVHSKFICIDRKIIFFGSANVNRPGMTRLSELNVQVDDQAEIAKWLAWRKNHLQECEAITDYRSINYNRIVAWIEGLFC